MSNIRIIVFDDSDNIRDSLGLLLDGSDGFELIGSFANAKNLVADIEHLSPDVVLMDIDMPELNGLKAVSRLHLAFPVLPVIMLTVFDDEEKIYTALCNGAMGYMLKNTPPLKLLDAIREVYEGGAPMTPSVARKVMLHFQQPVALKKGQDFLLSPREKDVLALLVDGLSYKMIADNLKISLETVKTHMKRIYEKLHVTSMTEAVAKAITHKLIDN